MSLNGISNQFYSYPPTTGLAPQNFQGPNTSYNNGMCMPFPGAAQPQGGMMEGLINLVGTLVNSLTQMVGQLVSLITGGANAQNGVGTSQFSAGDPLLNSLYGPQTGQKPSSGSWLDSILDIGKGLFSGLLGDKESSGGGFWGGLVKTGGKLLGGLF